MLHFTDDAFPLVGAVHVNMFGVEASNAFVVCVGQKVKYDAPLVQGQARIPKRFSFIPSAFLKAGFPRTRPGDGHHHQPRRSYTSSRNVEWGEESYKVFLVTTTTTPASISIAPFGTARHDYSATPHFSATTVRT